MRMEDLKREFPKMPEEMRTMIQEQVAKQLDAAAQETGEDETRVVRRTAGRRRKNTKRMAVLILAATVVLGTTAFAGTRLYEMYTERAGQYGMKTVVEMGGSRLEADPQSSGGTAVTEAESKRESESAAAKEEQDSITERIQSGGETSSDGTESGSETAGAEAAAQEGTVKLYENATVQATYLPEEMVEAPGGGVWYYEDQPWVGGITRQLYYLDTGDDFEIVDRDVTDSEEFEVNGHDGVYLTRRVNELSTEVQYDRIIYVTYPEARLVVKLYVADNVSREEAMRFAEGLELVEQDGSENAAEKPVSWRDYLSILLTPETETEELKTSATREEMANTHKIGETFVLPSFADTGSGESGETQDIAVTVSSVQVADDLELLDPAYVDERLAAQTDENGKLLPNTMQYAKRGDGIDSTDEVFGEETVAQKLVYVTTEYTNTGDKPLYNILFLANVLRLEESEDGYSIYQREKARGSEACDMIQCSGLMSGEMSYYDVKSSGDHNGSNYIDELAPGQSVTVHFGFVVNEDELGYLYLGHGSGGAYEICESQLEIGYVDIRQ